MKIVYDFLSLRPVWTRRGLEVVWYAYFLGTLIQLGFFISFSYSAFGTVNRSYHLSIVYEILLALAHLALIRIFLELALKFLIHPREEVDAPTTAAVNIPRT